MLASYLAMQQSRRAKQQSTIKLARQLASDSAKVLNDQARLIELSVLLAAESIRRQPLTEGDAAIRRALALYPKAVPYKSGTTIQSFAFSTDSQRAAITSNNNVVSIIELPSGKVRQEVRTPARAVSLVTSPSGYLAVGLDDGTVQIIDSSNGNKIAELKVGGNAGAMAFSLDGRDLAVSESKSVHIFDTQGWKPLPRIDVAGGVEQIAFSQDGHMMVTGSEGVMAFSKRKEPGHAPKSKFRLEALRWTGSHSAPMGSTRYRAATRRASTRTAGFRASPTVEILQY